MNRCTLKMLLRSIRSSLGRYLAILGIVALGVGFFAGLKSSYPAMQRTAENYLRKQHFHDYQLLSTLGFTEGRIVVDGEEVSAFDERRLTTYRRCDVGFVFQFYNLIPNLTALENVELAARLGREPADAAEVLAQVGLRERAQNFPSQLSGGEQQRVAIARALAKRPKLLLCDEPTGALDYQTGKAILKLLQDSCRETGMTVIIITHNKALCAMADRVIRVKNGSILSEERQENVTPVEELEW